MWHDLRFGVRLLTKRPGFAAMAIITLALGIGANAAIFSVVNAVLLKPLPYEDPGKLVMLWESSPRRGVEQERVTLPNLTEWRDQTHAFDDVGYWSGSGSFNLLTGVGTEKANCTYAVSSLFITLRARPFLGRIFAPDEDKKDGHRAAIVSYEFWQRRLASDPNVLGRTLTIDTFGRREYSIIGVMPAGFHFPAQSDIWLAAGWDGLSRDRRQGHWLSVVARLKPGVTVAQAQRELSAIQGRIEKQYPELPLGSQVSVVPLIEQTIGRNMQRSLLILWGVVACVLLITCANLASLLLARSAERQKEIAIRLALGGGRWRLIRQLLTESLLLALIGGGLGILFALWGLNLLIRFNADYVARLNEAALDGSVLAFTLLISVVTGLLFGLLPALQSTRSGLNVALKDSGRGLAEGLHRSRLRSTLIASEVALSVVLLVAAGLMLRSFVNMLEVDRGFRRDHLLTAELDCSVSAFSTWMQATATRPQVTVQQLIERLQRNPQVQSVGAISTSAGGQITIEDRPPAPTSEQPQLTFWGVTPDYLRAMGIQLLTGRAFTEGDRLDTPRVAIISESLARRWFPNENPIGKRFYYGRLNPGQSPPPDRWFPQISPWVQIVATTSDVRTLNVEAKTRSDIYVPYWQWPMQTPTLVIRTRAEPMSLAADLRSEVKSVNASLPVPKIQTMDDRLVESVAQPRFQALLLGLFALLALTLVVTGVYGVVSYSVSQRTHEIGVRMALGAQAKDVLRMVLRQGMVPAVVGIGVGTLAAFLSTRLMTSLLFGVSENDPLTFLSIGLLLLVVAFLACWLPARSAAKVDPMVALRSE
jgi:putative ABC transport system permease protein